tara:strand:- start:207 stop:821 length:615 start_codon:yes stop_codon:yes gene_type:complete
MEKPTDAFLNQNRPKKRRLQAHYYQLIAKWFNHEPISVLDLPSLNLDLTLEMFDHANLNLSHYWAIERDEEISNVLRETIAKYRDAQLATRFRFTQGEVLGVINTATKRNWSPIQFFNLDFCGALGSSYRAFILPHLIHRIMGDKTAVAITFNPRSPSKPREKILHAFQELAPKFYNIDLISLEKNSYSDTSAMLSWLMFLERR